MPHPGLGCQCWTTEAKCCRLCYSLAFPSLCSVPFTYENVALASHTVYWSTWNVESSPNSSQSDESPFIPQAGPACTLLPLSRQVPSPPLCWLFHLHVTWLPEPSFEAAPGTYMDQSSKMKCLSGALHREELNHQTYLIYCTYTCNLLEVVRPSFLGSFDQLLCMNKLTGASAPTLCFLKGTFQFQIFHALLTLRFLPKTSCWTFGIESVNTIFTVHCLALSPAFARWWLICNLSFGPRW